MTEGSTVTTTTYDYGAGAAYALGQVVGSSSVQGANTQTTANTYAWYDGAALSGSVVTGTGQQAPGTAALTYDAFGLVTLKTFTGGTSSTISYLYDAASQGVISTETAGASSFADRWYRMGGVNQWHYSNRYDPAGGDASTSGAVYTVRGGDTLAGIAAQIWGDASLWYKLAEANGLSANSGLSEGQQLRVPPGVFRAHLNAATFIPYDAAAFIGPTDVGPVYPKPQNRDGCGVIGALLLAVVAVAVTAVVGGPVTSFFSKLLGATSTTASAGAIAAAKVGGGVIGGAVAGAAGSVASQGVGLATGLQDKFSWNSVGLAAIGGGIGGGLQGGGVFGTATGKLFTKGAIGIRNGILDAAVRGTVSSALTQGIGVATGMQDKFSWAGVVGAGLGAGIGHWIGGGLAATNEAGGNTMANHLRHLGTGAASALANAGARSVIEGTDFGDNVLAALPDVIGQTIYNMIAHGVRAEPVRQAAAPQIAYDMSGLFDGDEVAGSAAADFVVTDLQPSPDDRLFQGADGGSGRWDDLPFVPANGHPITFVHSGVVVRDWVEHTPEGARTGPALAINRAYQSFRNVRDTPRARQRALAMLEQARTDGLAEARHHRDGYSYRAWRRFSPSAVLATFWQSSTAAPAAQSSRGSPRVAVQQDQSAQRTRQLRIERQEAQARHAAWIAQDRENVRQANLDSYARSFGNPTAGRPVEQPIAITAQMDWEMSVARSNIYSLTPPPLLAAPLVPFQDQRMAQAVTTQARTAGLNNGPGLGTQSAGLVVDFIPIVGAGKSLVDTALGYDSVTGEPINRWVAAGGILLGLVPGGKLLTKGKKLFNLGGDALRHVDEANDVARHTLDATPVAGTVAAAEVSELGANALARAGRAGKQARLRELANDPLVSSADRGWIRQEMNSIVRGQRRNIRVPFGKVLAHRRGFEARSGYSYRFSDLQDVGLHKLQHKYEGY